jgi:hypothetical protein
VSTSSYGFGFGQEYLPKFDELQHKILLLIFGDLMQESPPHELSVAATPLIIANNKFRIDQLKVPENSNY